MQKNFIISLKICNFALELRLVNRCAKELLAPDYIFESSWEVCNKVGGIYTVLSTRAKTLQGVFPDRIFFIGPDVWLGKENPLFTEDVKLLQAWRKHALEKDDLKIRIGRWNIPGNPIAILVDFTPFYTQKNDIYTQAWIDFQVDSLHAYGDYDEASMFSYAAGKVVESYYRFNLTENDKVVYQAHEWMTGIGGPLFAESGTRNSNNFYYSCNFYRTFDCRK